MFKTKQAKFTRRWSRDDQTYFIAACREARRDSHRICLGHHEQYFQNLPCPGSEPLTEGRYSGVEKSPPWEAWTQILIASNQVGGRRGSDWVNQCNEDVIGVEVDSGWSRVYLGLRQAAPES
jgi:hypothetical protein